MVHLPPLPYLCKEIPCFHRVAGRVWRQIPLSIGLSRRFLSGKELGAKSSFWLLASSSQSLTFSGQGSRFCGAGIPRQTLFMVNVNGDRRSAAKVYFPKGNAFLRRSFQEEPSWGCSRKEGRAGWVAVSIVRREGEMVCKGDMGCVVMQAGNRCRSLGSLRPLRRTPVTRDDCMRLRFVVSHPCRDETASWMGHPAKEIWVVWSCRQETNAGPSAPCVRCGGLRSLGMTV